MPTYDEALRGDHAMDLQRQLDHMKARLYGSDQQRLRFYERVVETEKLLRENRERLKATCKEPFLEYCECRSCANARAFKAIDAYFAKHNGGLVPMEG